MSLIVPDEGEVELLRRMVKPVGSDSLPLKIKLYTALAGSLGNATKLADFTEATFAGYAPKDLTPSIWADPQSVLNIAQTQYGPGFLNWLASAGSEVVIGYYVTDNAVTKVLWAEPFVSPVTVTHTTPASVYPYLRLRSLF